MKKADLQISQVGEFFAEAQSLIGYFLRPVKTTISDCSSWEIKE